MMVCTNIKLLENGNLLVKYSDGTMEQYDIKDLPDVVLEDEGDPGT